jgi:hypothetical protein
MNLTIQCSSRELLGDGIAGIDLSSNLPSLKLLSCPPQHKNPDVTVFVFNVRIPMTCLVLSGEKEGGKEGNI